MPTSTRIPARRRLGRLAPAAVAAALVVAGLAGCSSGGSGGATETVSLWTWNANSPQKLWSEVQSALAKQGTHVQINVRVINSTSYASVLQTALNGGSAPDMFYGSAGEPTLSYAAAGQLAPLNDIVDTSTISASAISAASYDGKIYGVPDSADTMSVLYNKDVLAAHHLTVPTTWSQWLDEMKTLKADGITPMYVMGVQEWMLALQMDAVAASTLPSSYITSVTDKKSGYDDAAYIKSLTAFQQLAPYLENGWQATGSANNEQETALALGKTAFVIDGIFNIAAVKQVNPDVKLGQFLVPSPDGQQAKIDWYPDANFEMSSKISDPKVKDAVEKIMKFTATKQFGDIWNRVTGTISPIKGAVMPASNPLSVQAAHWFATVPISPLWGIRSPMDTPSPTSGKVVTTNDGIFNAQQKIAVPLLEGKITPKQAAEQIQQAQSWYLSGTQ